MKTALLLVAAALAFVAAQSTWAQVYPSKPIRLIVHTPPGGGTDSIARTIAQRISKSLGQSVLVDNRPGGGGTIGFEAAFRAEPDGYTLVMIPGGYAAMAASYKLSYDPVNDIEPIIMIGEAGLVFAMHPSVPIKSVKELIAYAKANPGKLDYGSAGTGGINHLMGELFELDAGVDLVHVPYKGSGPSLIALIGGEIPLLFPSIVPAIPHIKAGRLRAIAVSAGKRSRLLPEVPTVNETVPGYEVTTWYGVGGPKGLPRDIVARWNKEVAKFLQTEEMKTRALREGLELTGDTPERFLDLVRRDVEKWKRVIKEAKITVAN